MAFVVLTPVQRSKKKKAATKKATRQAAKGKGKAKAVDLEVERTLTDKPPSRRANDAGPSKISIVLKSGGVKRKRVVEERNEVDGEEGSEAMDEPRKKKRTTSRK